MSKPFPHHQKSGARPTVIEKMEPSLNVSIECYDKLPEIKVPTVYLSEQGREKTRT